MAVLNFHLKFIHWVTQRLTTPMYSMKINGVVEGFFAGQRGVMEGDPLFVLSMEVFSQLMNRAVVGGEVAFHAKCSRTNLSHLCFTADLMIFTEATQCSLQGVRGVLNDFYSLWFVS